MCLSSRIKPSECLSFLRALSVGADSQHGASHLVKTSREVRSRAEMEVQNALRQARKSPASRGYLSILKSSIALILTTSSSSSLARKYFVPGQSLDK